CRLFVTDVEAYKRTTNGALRATTLLAVPVALSCALFPDIGVAIYSRRSFVHAEDNLRILAMFLFLVYFSMPLGTALEAAGKQRHWAGVQALCVVVSVVLDPILIPYFQRRNGNGGMGVCVAAVASEVLVVSCAVVLAPRGIFERRFWRTLLLAGISGLTMVAVARALAFLSPFVVAPFALGAYVLVLWLTGALEPAYIEALRAAVKRKLSRLRGVRNV
ncbi:MAG TPA: polysaccharide biosynthesis C-terminal domain-containing protein, partial [Polyangiaceae bacterium]